MNSQTLKAFVSSTFGDLKQHRARAIDTLERGGFHVDPMEKWDASSAAPTHFCLERLEDCDLCVLIVAFRRGFIPTSQTLSITQMEVQRAVEMGIDVLVFLLHDEETSWPAEHDERRQDSGIGEWRTELKTRYGVGFFRGDPASLDVGPSVMRWLQERAAKAGLTAPFDFASFLEPKREGFVGRGWLFEEIEAWRTKRREKSLLIVGDPGIGKSAIVAELLHRQAERVLAYHCCRADDGRTLQPGLVVRALAAQAARRLPGYAARLKEPAAAEAVSEGNCLTNPVSAYEHGLLVPLARLPAPAEGTCYLVFDALDEALSGEVRGVSVVEMLAARLEQLPPWLRIVATTRREPGVLSKLRGLCAWPLEGQDPRNQDDVSRYVEERLRAEPVRGLTMAEAARLLVEKAAGNFLWAQQALAGLADEDDVRAYLERLPAGLPGIYLRFFERRFGDESAYEPVRRIWQVVTVAREPMTEKELSAVTGLHYARELPAVLRSVSAFLVRRKQEGKEDVLAIYHKSLADWLTDDETRRDTIYYADSLEGHQRLAEWCRSEYQRGPRKMDGYALRHLPAHLIETQRWDDLAALLTDLFYLEAKAEAGLVFELAADFGAVRKVLPGEHPWHRRLGLLEEALGLDLAFLGRHPSALFQTLWNRCWWYDCAGAAKYYREEQKRAVTQDEPRSGFRWLQSLRSVLWALWNQFRRYDHPETFYPSIEEPNYVPAPWEAEGPKLAELLEQWRKGKSEEPGFRWLRMLRPPSHHLGTALRRILAGHEYAVTSIAVSPDGKRLASGSQDKTVCLWDAETGVELRRLQGHTYGVTSVSFSVDGKRLASGSDDKTVRLWDAETGVELRRLEGLMSKLKGHTHAVSNVSFSVDGKRLASFSDDKTVRLWDAKTGRELHRLEGDTGRVTSVSFSVDGKRLASGSWDTVHLWDVETGVELRLLYGCWGVQCLSFSVDGKRLAAGLMNGTVRLWDVETGVELRRLDGHTDYVTSVSFSVDGKRLASGSVDKTVRLWDVETGVELRRLDGHTDYVTSVSFSVDGKRLASGSHGNTVRLWDAESGKCLEVIQGGTNSFAAARAADFLWRAVREPLETVIKDRNTSQAVAWIALTPDDITAHPSGRIWAGRSADYVCLFALEGGEDGSPSSLDKSPSSQVASP